MPVGGAPGAISSKYPTEWQGKVVKLGRERAGRTEVQAWEEAEMVVFAGSCPLLG